MAIVSGKLCSGDAPLPVTTFFMSVRRTELHRPQRPGRRFGPLRGRFRQQLKLIRFDTTLTVRGAETVGPRIASTDDDHPFTLRRDRLIAEMDAGRALILLGEVFHREMHALQLASWNRQLARLFSSHRQSHSIELLAQLFAGHVFADCDTGLKPHSFDLHLFQPPIDDPLFHLEVWNTIAK